MSLLFVVKPSDFHHKLKRTSSLTPVLIVSLFGKAYTMIKEAKHVDFYTTGRQPSNSDFARISAWIKRDKKKQPARHSKPTTGHNLLIS